jgi:hypothetical protein
MIVNSFLNLSTIIEGLIKKLLLRKPKINQEI